MLAPFSFTEFLNVRVLVSFGFLGHICRQLSNADKHVKQFLN